MYLPPIPLLSTIVYSRDILPKPNGRVAGEETAGAGTIETNEFWQAQALRLGLGGLSLRSRARA
jgi:hypothetical protein